MAIAPPLLIIAHYLQMRDIGRTGLLGIGTAAWYAVGTTAMVWLGPLAPRRKNAPKIAPWVDRPSPIDGPHARASDSRAQQGAPIEIAAD